MRRWSFSRLLLAALALALAAAGAGMAIAAVGGHAPGSDPVRLTVDAKAHGRVIPSGFAGLSTEYWAIPEFAGKDPAALDPAFEQLLRNLAPGARPVLRIGGDSTDWTWWPVRGIRKPLGIRYTLTPQWLEISRALVKATGARLILGINLEADDRRLAAGEAGALVEGLGRHAIRALEIGNEPELYGSFGWYRTDTGREVPGRPRGYDQQAFTADFSAFARSMPQIPLAGPSTGSPSYLSELGRFVGAERRIGVVTVHAYPLKRCSATTRVTTGQLLSNAASVGLANSLAPLAAIAHRHHVPLRIDEMNSVSCGGERGVSDTFASGLWMLDALFALSRAGVDGVNIHTPPRSINQMITFREVSGTWEAHVAPIYYGMLAFARATPPGSRLIRISGTAAPGLSTWATLGRDGDTRVVLINKDTSVTRTVNLRAPARASAGVVELLRAPGIAARTGVTLGGQGFGGETTTGTLSGTSTASAIKSSGGKFSLKLPPATAALVTIPAG